MIPEFWLKQLVGQKHYVLEIGNLKKGIYLQIVYFSGIVYVELVLKS